MEGILVELKQAIVDGNRNRARALVEMAIEAKEPAVSRLLNEAMIPGMEEVGSRFACGEYFIPDMLLSARAMQTGLNLLEPFLAAEGGTPHGHIVIGTVKGDLHDIGKNLVGGMLRGAGFTVRDLGVDVSPETFVEAIRNEHPQIVALSALITTTIPAMEETIRVLNASGLREGFKIMVGGAPVTPEFAQRIGADGYGANAGEAVALTKRLEAQLQPVH